MDELIVLLIRGLARLFSQPQQQPRQGQRLVPPPLPGNPDMGGWTPPVLPAPSRMVQRQQATIATTARKRAISDQRARDTKRVPVKVAKQIAAPPPPAVAASVDTAVAPAVAKVASVNPHTANTIAAPTIRRWLTPQTLRKQFILTEVFQLPLALRDDARRQI